MDGADLDLKDRRRSLARRGIESITLSRSRTLMTGVILGTVLCLGSIFIPTFRSAQLQSLTQQTIELKTRIQQIKSVELLDELERVRWEQLEELYEEISNHALLEEEMKAWLDSQYRELEDRSKSTCNDEQQFRLRRFQASTDRAVDRIREALTGSTVATDRQKRLRFKQAHKCISEWNAALLEICPQTVQQPVTSP